MQALPGSPARPPADRAQAILVHEALCQRVSKTRGGGRARASAHAYVDGVGRGPGAAVADRRWSSCPTRIGPRASGSSCCRRAPASPPCSRCCCPCCSSCRCGARSGTGRGSCTRWRRRRVHKRLRLHAEANDLVRVQVQLVPAIVPDPHLLLLVTAAHPMPRAAAASGGEVPVGWGGVRSPSRGAPAEGHGVRTRACRPACHPAG
jgi:hypothetical protein